MAPIRYSPAMALPGNRRHMANVLAGLGVTKGSSTSQRAPLTPAQLAMLQYAKTQQRKVVQTPQADTGLFDQGGGGTEQPPPDTQSPPDTLPDEQGEEILRPDPLTGRQATPAPSNLRGYALGAIAVLAAILLLRK